MASLAARQRVSCSQRRRDGQEDEEEERGRGRLIVSCCVNEEGRKRGGEVEKRTCSGRKSEKEGRSLNRLFKEINRRGLSLSASPALNAKWQTVAPDKR